MNYHIDTIPIWDSYRADTECPLCTLKKQNETRYIESFLGASYMEPDTRIETNEKGFCIRHFSMLFMEKNRLGLGLMTHSHLKEAVASVTASLNKAKKAAETEASRSKIGRIAGKLTVSPARTEILAAADEIEKRLSTCVVCERLDTTLDRYAYTIVYMWKGESAFKKALSESKGFCLTHISPILRHAVGLLSAEALNEFVETISSIQSTHMQRIDDELEWFTLKFDHRNQDAPWKNSADAVERSIQKIQGPF